MPRKLSARNSGNIGSDVGDNVVELDHVAGKSARPSARPSGRLDRDTTSNTKDYFVEKNGLKFAGTHLLVELWGASNLDDGDAVEEMLREATTTCGATLLFVHVHRFSENGGISGVAVLAESHISIHTWPERGYAAVDVFMCGGAEPHKAVAVLRDVFSPSHVQVSEHKRGMVE